MLNPTSYHDTIKTMLERNDDTGAYSISYDWSEVSPSTAIMESVSAIEGVDPVELDPLHRVLDPDALDELLARPVCSESAPLEISFRYGSVDVVARRDGRIDLRPDDDGSAD